MYERFTDAARKTMQLAIQEANRLGHKHVDAEHVLLGLLKEGTGAGSRILREGYDAPQIKIQVEKSIRPSEAALPGRRPPSTPRARQTVQDAAQEARQLGKDYVGTEHLLLALLRQPEGVAALVLQNCGVTYADVKSRLNGPHAPMVDEVRDASAAADPQQVDRLIRQAIGECWKRLPPSRQNVDEVRAQTRRIVERALRDFGEDAEAFGS